MTASARSSCARLGSSCCRVEPRPAVVLRVRELDVLRPEPLGHLEDLADVVDVQPVQHDIQHHGVVVSADQGRDLRLQLESARAAEEIVELARAVLEGELDVIEPRGL